MTEDRNLGKLEPVITFFYSAKLDKGIVAIRADPGREHRKSRFGVALHHKKCKVKHFNQPRILNVRWKVADVELPIMFRSYRYLPIGFLLGLDFHFFLALVQQLLSRELIELRRVHQVLRRCRIWDEVAWRLRESRKGQGWRQVWRLEKCLRLLHLA